MAPETTTRRATLVCSRSRAPRAASSTGVGNRPKGCNCSHRLVIDVYDKERGVFYVREKAPHSGHVLGSEEDKRLLRISTPIRQRLIDWLEEDHSYSNILTRMDNFPRVEHSFFRPLGVRLDDLPSERYAVSNDYLSSVRDGIKKRGRVFQDDTMALNHLL